MTLDQKYILSEMIKIIDETKPDAIVIAGDIYDRAVPPVDAVELVDRTFSKILLKMSIPIIAIAGNHDSGERISFASSILEDNGLYINGKFEDRVKKVVIKDKFGPVNFYLIPFTEPVIIKEALGDESIKTHDDAMKAIIKSIDIDKNERNVAVAHGFITGTKSLEQSDSERPLSIGGTDFVDVNYFSDFNYTALGHLHGRQRVKGEKVMYSGSIMKYSFSEVKHKKGVNIVDIDENGEVDVNFRQLIPLRDMRIIKGEIDKLLDEEVYKDTNTEDYLKVILTDKGELIDPINKLRQVYPNVLSLERLENINSSENLKELEGSGVKKKSKLDLFEEFYNCITEDEFGSDKKDIIKSVIEEVQGEMK